MLMLRNNRVTQKWSALLPDCSGEGPGLIEIVENNLHGYGVTGLSWRLESAAPGLLRGMFGRRRSVLAIRNRHLSEWLVCIGARDYGSFLSVTWYLTVSPSLLNRMRGLMSGGVVGLVLGGQETFVRDLDVFGQQDLSAYSTATLMAIQDAVQELVETRKLDIAQLNRHGEGMFAVA